METLERSGPEETEKSETQDTGRETGYGRERHRTRRRQRTEKELRTGKTRDRGDTVPARDSRERQLRRRTQRPEK